MKQCFNIVTSVFGSQEKELINKFSIMIKSYFSNISKQKDKQSKIKAYHFLYLLLEEYHQNKLDNQNKIQNQNQISFENFKEIETSFHYDKKLNPSIEKNATTTKNLEPEFDNIFKEMKLPNNDENSFNETKLNNDSTTEIIFENQIDYEKVFSNNQIDYEKVSSNGSNRNSANEKYFTEYEKQIMLLMETNVQE